MFSSSEATVAIEPGDQPQGEDLLAENGKFEKIKNKRRGVSRPPYPAIKGSPADSSVDLLFTVNSQTT